jgi:hypothetical protein
MRGLLSLLLLLPLVGNAADRLQGAWQSDHEETMRFVKAHTRLEPRQTDFLNGSLGRLRLVFDGNQMHYEMPDFDLPIQGKSVHFAGINETYLYRLLGADQDSVALMVEKDHGRDRIIHIHFVSDTVFWLYSESPTTGFEI